MHLLPGYSESESDGEPHTAVEAFEKHMLISSEAVGHSIRPLEPEVAVAPKDVLAHASPAEAQELQPLYGPLGPGQNRPGGLYRKFRNHEMGHIRECTKGQAVALAAKFEAERLEMAAMKPVDSTQTETAKQDKLAETLGVSLPPVSKKRLRNDDPTSSDFQGPWAPYEGEKERREKLRLLSEEMNARAAEDKEQEAAVASVIPPKPEIDPNIATVTFHIKDQFDYQGRSWIQAPPLQGAVMPGEEGEPSNYALPRRAVHAYSGHTKGIHRIRWFPKSAHLLLSGAIDNTCRIWSVEGNRKCIATYLSHTKPVRDINFTADGTKFYSCSFDTTVKLWDTEYGKVISTFGNDKVPYCVSVHPDPALQNVVICASQNKKAVQYDANVGQIVQEYNEHLAAVNSVTFCENGQKIVTTADDKKMFIWEFGIGVVVKHIAEPYMHAMPAVQLDPYGKFLACQSMDNQIVVYEGRGRFRLQSRKRFRGHSCTGYAILPGFSPDSAFLISGDSVGRCWFWDWKTSKVYRSLSAHEGPCMSAIWHPHKKSMVATCGWDGLIKLWE